MKEFKIIIQTIDCLTVNAESEEEAWEQVKKGIDPRVLGGPITVQIVPVDPEADTPANS